MLAEEIVKLLFNVDTKHVVNSIPDGLKENVYYILSEESNQLRSDTGKHKVYPDDCGAWDAGKGSVPKTHYLRDNDTMKFVYFYKGKYCTMKRQFGSREYDEIEPQPPPENIIILTRYCTTLKGGRNYKRRVSRIYFSSGKASPYAIVEYIGKYPEKIAPRWKLEASRHDVHAIRSQDFGEYIIEV